MTSRPVLMACSRSRPRLAFTALVGRVIVTSRVRWWRTLRVNSLSSDTVGSLAWCRSSTASSTFDRNAQPSRTRCTRSTTSMRPEAGPGRRSSASSRADVHRRGTDRPLCRAGRRAQRGVRNTAVDAVGAGDHRPEPAAGRVVDDHVEQGRRADPGFATDDHGAGRPGPGPAEQLGGGGPFSAPPDEVAADPWAVRGIARSARGRSQPAAGDGSAATRKPRLSDELSGVLELRAATR